MASLTRDVLGMGELLDVWLRAQAALEGWSPSTFRTYRGDLVRFESWLLSTGRTAAEGIRVIVDFLEAERGRGIAEATLARRIAALRMLYARLWEERKIDRPITWAMPRARPWRKLPTLLSREELDRLFSACVGESRALRLRNRALVRLIYSTGCRASEVCGMQLEMLDLDGRAVRVIGKGNVERVVVFGVPAQAALAEYLADGRPRLWRADRPTSAVFLSSHGHPLERSALWRVVKAAADAVGLPRATVRPHALRHSCATHLLEGGADVRLVQELLGHADVRTTEGYTHVTRQRMHDAHRRFHPAG